MLLRTTDNIKTGLQSNIATVQHALKAKELVNDEAELGKRLLLLGGDDKQTTQVVKNILATISTNVAGAMNVVEDCLNISVCLILVGLFVALPIYLLLLPIIIPIALLSDLFCLFQCSIPADKGQDYPELCPQKCPKYFSCESGLDDDAILDCQNSTAYDDPRRP